MVEKHPSAGWPALPGLADPDKLQRRAIAGEAGSAVNEALCERDPALCTGQRGCEWNFSLCPFLAGRQSRLQSSLERYVLTSAHILL